MKLGPVLACFVPLTGVCVDAFAGPVNSPNSYPTAAMNSSGEFVMAGNLKLMVAWKGKFESELFSAAPFRFSDAKSPFESSIASATVANSSPAAIVCAGNRVALYTPERTPSAPSGSWRELASLGGEGWKDDAVTCAMTSAGKYAVAVPSRNLIMFDGGEKVSLKLPAGGRWQLLASGDAFVLVGALGKLVWIVPQQDRIAVSSPVSHDLDTTSEMTNFAASSDTLLRADGDGVYLASIERRPGEIFPIVGPATRLSVAPCQDNQRCGASLAADGTWSVSGYWGTFLGRGKVSLRQKIPGMSLETGGVAIAHQSAMGRFVMVGNDDGEIGTFNEPSLQKPLAAENLSDSADERWVVWTKLRRNQVRPESVLFPWTAGLQRREGGEQADNERMVVVHHGSLPDPVPSDWVSWEPQVRFAAPDFPEGNATPLSFAPSSTDWWWVRALEVDATRNIAAANGVSPAPVVVSVVDSGAQLDHPWLVPGLYHNPDEVPGNNIDDDGNGFVDDVVGYDFVEEDSVPQDEFGHGTHVAGLIAAVDPVRQQPVALNQSVRLRVLRALDRYGKSNSIDLARAVRYAVVEGSDFLNCSWGGGPVTQVLRDAFAYALAKNVVVISSAGNDRLNTDVSPQVPKLFPGVISVAALTEGGKLADFSSWGAKSVAWMAPGANILSTLPASSIGEKSGTSMASPIAVNGASWIFGLLKARFPERGPEFWGGEMRSLLCKSGSTSGVEGKSQCGKIAPLKATQALFGQ